MRYGRAYRVIIPAFFELVGCSPSPGSSKLRASDHQIDPDARPSIPLFPHNLVEELSAVVCEQLLSCCRQSDRIVFFSYFIDDERLAGPIPRMQPNAALDFQTCPALLEELHSHIWLERLDAGQVIFHDRAGQYLYGNTQARITC